METLLGSTLLREVVQYLAAGLLVVGFVFAVPPRALQTIGKVPGLSPNWVTFWRLPVSWGGYYVYFFVNPFVGYLVVVFGYALDRIDGKMAHALSLLGDARYPGRTRLGEWLDPLVDKLCVPPFLAFFCGKGLLPWEIWAVMVAAEFVGTITRPPFDLAQSRMRKIGATGVGKLKFMLQFTTLLMCLPAHQGWVSLPRLALSMALGGATLLSVLSAVSRLRLTRSVDAAVDRATSIFKH